MKPNEIAERLKLWYPLVKERLTSTFIDAYDDAIEELEKREPVSQATIEFSMAETALTERALHEYMRRNMCRSDRNICESAFSKLQLSKRGREILEAQRQQGE